MLEMRQDDLLSLFKAIHTGNTDRFRSEFKRMSRYHKKVQLDPAACKALVDQIVDDRADMCQGLLLAALLRRQKTGGFDPLIHFLTRARTAAVKTGKYADFFAMNQLFAAKRRQKDFVLFNEISQKTYRQEMENVQALRKHIATLKMPAPVPSQGPRKVVFCASFLPESYNIKHAQLVIDNIVFLNTYRKDLHCTLLLTHETVFDDPAFPHYDDESDNIDELRTRIEAANAKYGLEIEIKIVGRDLPHYQRFRDSVRIIQEIGPDAVFYVGGYCKCESFYVSTYFADTIPSIFLATSASNTVGPQYSAVFSKDDKNPLTGAEGKIKVAPSASFEGFHVDLDAMGDTFYQDHEGAKFILSALSNERIFNAFSASKPEFFTQLEGFFDRNPNVIWVLLGVKNVEQMKTFNPIIETLVKRGKLVVKGLVQNFGYYLSHSRLFVSLPNSVGGGFAGFSATYLEVPTVYCKKSDLPGLFHLPDLCFEEDDYKGFFDMIDWLANDDTRLARAVTGLQDIKATFSLANVGSQRFHALEDVIAEFHAAPATTEA